MIIPFLNLISIYCFSSDKTVAFKPFLVSFTDQVTPSWSSQETFSRMDPVNTYKSTKRKINFSFDVPSSNLDDSISNHIKINHLLDSLYPIFSVERGQMLTDMVGAANVSASPLFRIKFSNYISKDGFDITEDGLLGIIQNLNFKPELESGFFIDGENIYPKLFKVNINFDVLHETEIDNKFNNTSYNSSIVGRYSSLEEEKLQSYVETKIFPPEEAEKAAKEPAATNPVSGVEESQYEFYEEEALIPGRRPNRR